MPVASFDDGDTELISSTPYNLTFDCSDTELEGGNNYLFVDGVLNQTSTNEYFIFNYPVGSYELDLICSDPYRNSTNASISLTYTQSCIVSIGGLIENERYRSLNQSISTTCSNGVNITDCSYSINNYAYESFNCSGDNILLEIGSNKVKVMVGDDFSTTEELKVFARGTESGMSSFIILFVLVGMLMFIFWFTAKKYDALIIHIFAVLIIGLLAYYLLAFSIWVSVMLFAFAFLYFIYQTLS